MGQPAASRCFVEASAAAELRWKLEARARRPGQLGHDANPPVGAVDHPLLCDRRPKHVLEERFRRRVITNEHKRVSRGRIVTTFVLGRGRSTTS